MRYFYYKSQNDGTKGPRLLGQIFLGAGLVVMLVPLFFEVETDPLKIALVGGGAFLTGLILSSIKSRILIDFDRKKFKEYKSIIWFKYGEWKVLPEIEQVELIHHSFRKSYVPNGITPTLSGQVTSYKIVLLANGAKFLVLEYTEEKDAIVALEEVKERLGI